MNWIDTIVQGILLGGLYALFAAGLSLVFGIMRLVNLAHGDLIVLGAYLILLIVSLLGLSPFVAALIALPLMFGLGYALQKVVLNRVLGEDILPPLLVTFGIRWSFRTRCSKARQPIRGACPRAMSVWRRSIWAASMLASSRF